MRIGAHESVAGGLHLAFERARNDGAAAVQLFTKNANAWRDPELTNESVETFRAHARESQVPVLAHNSYLVNLASGDDAAYARSRASFLTEVNRCAALGVDYVVFHPGSCGARAKGEGDESFAARQDAGLTRIAEALSWVHREAGEIHTRILLENSAGSGGCLGCSFEHLATIVARTDFGAERLGVCFDTQHAYASGYDLTTDEGYAHTWREFDQHLGLSRLVAFHLNDSKKALGSRVDRHDNIGAGLMGLGAFARLVNDPRFANHPAVLETEPSDDKSRPYGDEIARLQSLVHAAQ